MDKILYVIFWCYIGLFLINYGAHSPIILFLAGMWIVITCIVLLHMFARRIGL